jgi:hypothetical protein
MFRNRSVVDLLLVSMLVLFTELACIRWFPAHVVFLSFFTNIVLLATFVGMSVGCLLATRKVRHITYTPFFLIASLFIGGMVDQNINAFKQITDVGNQQNPDVIFFGAEGADHKNVEFTVPIEAMAGLFFLLAGACMVGPGQELGRAFNRVRNRTAAYAADLGGSLVGIAAFAAISYFQQPPVVWFAAISLLILPFLAKDDPDAAPGPLARLSKIALVVPPVLAVFTSYQFSNDPNAVEVHWSPYYRIEYSPRNQEIQTNGTGHQMMIARGEPSQSPYDLPYLFQRELKRPEYKRILVIGAGSGNDISRALYWCGPDTRIDAVDIDPVIQKLGMKYHPNRPYDDPRITRHLNDGRNFLRNCEPGTYDLVVFALVDSLVLHTGYSSGVRLESYLFTTESFEDVKRALKPDGIYTVYNFFRQGWLVARIREQLRLAFGTDPVVMIDPPYKKGDVLPMSHNFGSAGIGFFFAGQKEAIEPLRAKFATESFWVPGQSGMSKELPGRFAASQPMEIYENRKTLADALEANRPMWVPLRETAVEDSQATANPLRLSTDDWPFLYVKEPHIPKLTLRSVVLILGLSLALWGIFSPWGRGKAAADSDVPAPECGLLIRSFLLGAGFMLIETKAVVQMALLFGSTWNVNTFVFASILIMALVGNLYAGWLKPKRLEPYYIGLIVAIGLNLAIPLKVFLGMNSVVQAVLSCSLVFAPVLFAGVIFPTSFARAKRPDLFFGANVAGALVGGLAENASMVLGFRLLMIVALVFYAGSAFFGNKREGQAA